MEVPKPNHLLQESPDEHPYSNAVLTPKGRVYLVSQIVVSDLNAAAQVASISCTHLAQMQRRFGCRRSGEPAGSQLTSPAQPSMQ